MKKISLFSILMLFVMFSCKEEKEKQTQALTIGQLTISDEFPQPGDQLDLTYNSDKDVEAFYAYMVGDKNYPLDIDFKEANGEHKASIQIPDSAVALAFLIKADDTFDHNNKEGYLLPLYNEDGTPLAGSTSARALYALNSGPNYGITADPKDVAQQIKSDFDANPDIKSKWEAPYIQLAYKNNKEEGLALMDAYSNSVMANENATEKDYNNVLQFYSMLGNQEKYNATKAVALEKYPSGNIAIYDAVDKFQNEGNLDNKAAIFNAYAANHKKLGDIGNYMAGTLAQMYYQQKDMGNFETYLNKLDNKSRKASLLNNLAWQMYEKGDDLDRAENMSKQSLDLVSSLQKSSDDKPDYFTKKQYAKSLNSNYGMYADTYAAILFKQGKVKEAISFQEKAVENNSKDPESNGRYIDYLMANNQYETAADKATEFIKSGNGNSKIKDAYKTAYQKVNPEAKDVDEKLSAFEKEADALQMAEVKKTMLDEEAPGFTLKDTQGKDVSLASLKGKTVILDFWATWCGPCKASFPGMQEVVTKYKGDDNVVLLFVDTFERGPQREQMVEDFIKSNNYDFHVVYDPQVEGTNDFEVAGKYDISGIPTKVIIGPDGKMKFKSVGYNGSNEKLVKEMDIMIALLKS